MVISRKEDNNEAYVRCAEGCTELKNDDGKAKEKPSIDSCDVAIYLRNNHLFLVRPFFAL